MGLGWLGSVVGSVASGLFGSHSANEQNKATERMAKQQHEWNVSDYQHRYQWATQDMRSAGLNPILAATSGIGGSINGTSAGAMAMAPTPDFAGSINAALARDLSKKGLEIEQQNANTAQYKAETERRGMENEAKNLDSLVHYRDTSIRLAEEMQRLDMDIKRQTFDRDTQIAFARLDAEIEHWERQDMNGASMAAAAFSSAAAQQALAATAEANGISERELKEAERILTEQKGLTEEQRTLREVWRNSEMYRGSESATGLVSSILSLASMARGAKGAIESGIND